MENMINKMVELIISYGLEHEIVNEVTTDRDGKYEEWALVINDEKMNTMVIRYDEYSYYLPTDNDDEVEYDWAESGTIQEAEQYDRIEKLVKSIFVG